jgi:hypothetical protein
MIGMASSEEPTSLTTSKSGGLTRPRSTIVALHPVDQSGPHCTDQDERMLFHVLDLQELPDHEQLQRRADAAGHDDERRRETDEVVQPREERAMPEDLVDERVGGFLGRQMDGQPERARLAPLCPSTAPAFAASIRPGPPPVTMSTPIRASSALSFFTSS